MLKEIEQVMRVKSDMQSYLIKHRALGTAFSDRHIQLDSLKQQLNQLNEQLTESLTKLSKFQSHPAATLLDGYSRGNNLSIDNQSPDEDSMKKKLKKKRRREMRMCLVLK